MSQFFFQCSVTLKMSTVLFLALGLVASNVVAQGQTCFQGWMFYGESCYGFGETAVTWGDAEEMCRAYGAKLAEIETSDENDWIKKTAATKGGYSYWIGGSDFFHEGIWEWVSTRQVLTFTDWKAGEPNDEHHHEDCLSIVKFAGYTWNDWPCDSKYMFICEGSPMEADIGIG